MTVDGKSICSRLLNYSKYKLMCKVYTYDIKFSTILRPCKFEKWLLKVHFKFDVYCLDGITFRF